MSLISKMEVNARFSNGISVQSQDLEQNPKDYYSSGSQDI